MPLVLSLKATWLIFFFRSANINTPLSLFIPTKREVPLFQKVSIQVMFQTLTGSQGTPPSPLFDANNTNTHRWCIFHSLLLYVSFLSLLVICRRGYQAQPALTEGRSNLWGVWGWGWGGSPEENVHTPTIFRPGRKCGVDIIFITSKQEESND